MCYKAVSFCMCYKEHLFCKFYVYLVCMCYKGVILNVF